MRSSGGSGRSVALIEVLLVLMIVLVIASIVARFVFAPQLHGWEDGMWHSLGIDPGIGRLVTGVVAVTLLGVRWVAQRKRRGRNL